MNGHLKDVRRKDNMDPPPQRNLIMWAFCGLFFSSFTFFSAGCADTCVGVTRLRNFCVLTKSPSSLSFLGLRLPELPPLAAFSGPRLFSFYRKVDRFGMKPGLPFRSPPCFSPSLEALTIFSSRFFFCIFLSFLLFTRSCLLFP